MKNGILSNFLWRLFERFGALGISFIVSVIVARKIGPASYGIVSIVMVFISFFQLFIDGGFTSAIIQKDNIDDYDYSSVFYINLVSCVLMYAIIFVLAPFFSRFYHVIELTNMIRVLGLSLLIFGIKAVQQAYASRNMLFKTFFFATLAGTICAGIVGIILAYMGYGAWSIIYQYLTNNLVDTIVLWIMVEWRPKFVFSFNRAKAMFNYGWKILASSLLDNLYGNINKLLIGRIYSTSDLAYYDKGQSLPSTVVESINSSMDSVLLPFFSKKQNDIQILKKEARMVLKNSTMFIMPMMFAIFACSNNIILFLLGEAWMESSIYLKIFCVIYAFYPVHTLNLNLIKSVGRSDIFLKLEIFKKVVGIGILFITLFHGPLAIAIGMVFSSFISLLINTYPNRKLINYSFIDQMKDIWPNIIASLIIVISLLFLDFVRLPNALVLSMKLLLSLIIFYLYSVLQGINIIEDIIRFIKQSVIKK